MFFICKNTQKKNWKPNFISKCYLELPFYTIAKLYIHNWLLNMHLSFHTNLYYKPLVIYLKSWNIVTSCSITTPPPLFVNKGFDITCL